MVSKGTTGSSSAGGGQYNSGAGNALTLVNTTVSASAQKLRLVKRGAMDELQIQEHEIEIVHWEMIFDMLSMERIEPFLPEMGLWLSNISAVRTIARHFVEQIESLHDDVDAKKALVQHTFTEIAEATCRVPNYLDTARPDCLAGNCAADSSPEYYESLPNNLDANKMETLGADLTKQEIPFRPGQPMGALQNCTLFPTDARLAAEFVVLSIEAV